MPTDSTSRVVYVWGWWVWYYRFIALLVYLTGLLLVGLCYSAWDLLRDPGVVNIGLFLILALLVGAWVWVIRLTWRDGQSRVSRIAFLPEGQVLVARTLNFRTRRIYLADLESIQYQDLRPDPSEYREPILTIKVRQSLPLRIDLEGHILDKQFFRSTFRYRPTTPGLGSMRKKDRLSGS
jgi:hypothetical protein